LQINGTEIVPGASIGITFSDLGYRTTDEVLRDADLAMYEAKAGGRHRAVLFDAGMLERVTDRLQLEGDLRRAIGEGQLSVVYQPLFDLDPQRLLGFEALARWTHPVRGPISPAIFITMAEDCGQIEAVTAWVLEQSLAQLARWRGACGSGQALTMNINLSGRDLADPMLAARIAEALQRHGLPPEALTLEITETTLMERLDVALQTLQKLRELGVRFGIDDFGTGYSSLSYLSSLPIDSLKIDRSFVMGIERQPQNREIVRAVYELGRSLNKKIVAEGIETTEQLAILRQIGVQVGQGYLLGRPMRPDQIDADLLALLPH
jgi:EAL domain-containing protein (putative c-di-GMP-specific phosphodiesterase class I)